MKLFAFFLQTEGVLFSFWSSYFSLHVLHFGLPRNDVETEGPGTIRATEELEWNKKNILSMKQLSTQVPKSVHKNEPSWPQDLKNHQF